MCSGFSDAPKSEKSNVRSFTVKASFVPSITRYSLQGVDPKERDKINDNINRLLFDAQFRPDSKQDSEKARIIDDVDFSWVDFGVYGGAASQKAVNWDWPARNFGGRKGIIKDGKFGDINLVDVDRDIYGGEGCFAYSLFASKFVLGSVGARPTKIYYGSDGLKTLIENYADPGEHIQLNGGNHSVTFLGEDRDKTGFYFVDYGDNYGTSPSIYFGFWTYGADRQGDRRRFGVTYSSFAIYDTNGGRLGKTYSETEIHCPVEASVRLGDEILDSQTVADGESKETAFGTVSRNGDGIKFRLEVGNDYDFKIWGTGTGTMDVTQRYYKGNTLINERAFEAVPITPSTSIQVGALDADSAFTLSVNDGGAISTWTAQANETIRSADSDRKDNTQDQNNTSATVPGEDEGANPRRTSRSVARVPKSDSETDRQSAGTSQVEETTNNGQGTVADMSAQTILPFIDVGSSDWFCDSVKYVYGYGLMSGTNSTHFSPGVGTTRGMIVSVLHRLEGAPQAVAAAFGDVAGNQYYTDAVAWAAANGIVSGYSNGDFGPEDQITREQMTSILYRYARYKGHDTSASAILSGYTDAAQISDYALPAMQWVVGAGVVTGTSANTLSPGGTVTRAEIAAILARFCQNMPLSQG